MINPFNSGEIPPALVRLITCNLVAGAFKWGYTAQRTDAFYDRGCGGYQPFSQTVMQCFVDLLHGDSDAALTEYASMCNAYGQKNISLETALAHYSNGTRHLSTTPNEQANFSPLAFPLSLLTENFLFYHNVYYNLTLAFDFSLLINGAVCLVILLLAIQKRFDFPWLRRLRSRFTSTISRTHHAETKLFGWYVTILPTIGETWILFLLLVINIGVSVVYSPLYESIIGESKLIYFFKCAANRTGGLAFGLLPLTVLLAGRNNLISSLTGMPYASMIFYHKWAARTMTIYGLAHGMLWTVYCLVSGPGLLTAQYNEDPLWFWGYVISFLSVVVIVKSIYMWKSRHYELFLFLHIVLVAVFFYGSWKHCERLGWLGWIFLSILFWVGDRVLRLVKIFKWGGLRLATAKVLDSEHEIFQITVPNVGKDSFFPGCYAFLYVWNTSLFWHSHPFTLMQYGEDIVIVIKAKSGMTRELYDKLPKDGTTLPIRVAVEGPYGHEAPVDKYDHALIITSGTALPGPISYLQKMQKMEDCHFVWVISNERFLNYMRYALEPILTQKKGLFEIYITRPVGIDISWVPSAVCVHHGRPNLELVVHQDLSKWKRSAVISCALPFVDDQIRNYVAAEMATKQVDFFDELQVW